MENQLRSEERRASSSEDEQTQLENEPKLVEIKDWMESQVGWNERTDDDFINIFLRSSDFDVEVAKKTLSKFSENKKKIPQWWTNRSLKDPLILSVLDLKVNTIIIEKKVNYPTVIIYKLSRAGPRSNSPLLDSFFKVCTIQLEMLMKRPNTRMNGEIVIFDFHKYPWWLVSRMFSPTVLRDFNNTFNVGHPIKIVKAITLGTPYIGYAYVNLLKPFIPRALSDSVHILGSDLSALHEVVPKEVLPEEYGGEAGPMSEHDEATRNAVVAMFNLIEKDDYSG